MTKPDKLASICKFCKRRRGSAPLLFEREKEKEWEYGNFLPVLALIVQFSPDSVVPKYQV